MEASHFEGLWRGDNGALVRLLQSGDAISGTYTATAADPTVPYGGRLLVGTADGLVIGFVTSCPAPHRIMSWIGRLVGGGNTSVPEIHASCHKVDQAPNNLDATGIGAPNTVVFTKVRGSSRVHHSAVY